MRRRAAYANGYSAPRDHPFLVLLNWIREPYRNIAKDFGDSRPYRRGAAQISMTILTLPGSMPAAWAISIRARDEVLKILWTRWRARRGEQVGRLDIQRRRQRFDPRLLRSRAVLLPIADRCHADVEPLGQVALRHAGDLAQPRQPFAKALGSGKRAVILRQQIQRGGAGGKGGQGDVAQCGATYVLVFKAPVYPDQTPATFNISHIYT